MKKSNVAGIDLSTRSCHVVIRDLETGELVRGATASFRTKTETNPRTWMEAYRSAVELAGGLDDVVAMSVAGQQHGFVGLGADGNVLRQAILWNDNRSKEDAEDLIRELGRGDVSEGRKLWADGVGSVPVSSLTVSKLRWFVDHEPQLFKQLCAIALPHDWLTWQLMGADDSRDGLEKKRDIRELVTDRSEASGTGYYCAEKNEYRNDLIDLAARSELSKRLVLPRVVGKAESVGELKSKGEAIVLGPGCADNAATALGLDLPPGEVCVSIGTSGVTSLVSDSPIKDRTGQVTGFADATGRYLPLVGMLNASRVLDDVALLLGMTLEELSRAALNAAPGAEGLVVIPYFAGERNPRLPEGMGAVLGVSSRNLTAPNLARAAYEGIVASVARGLSAFRRLGVEVTGITLVGGASRTPAMRRIAASVLGLPVSVPEYSAYSADGAARQAAWTYMGGDDPPAWTPRLRSQYQAKHDSFIIERFEEVAEKYLATVR
ncbi:xylulokinase [Actinotignum timonense]|uniref:xylulokinase n=1 Tax=Actinotignum timonense TaxID=1870995 RepID=UPI0038984B26|nr:FGGY family carbohydrate kinase [Gleimia europaea]